MPAGLGAGSILWIAFEDTLGTYVEPATEAIAVPILSESLDHLEEKYLSEQIRQQTIHSTVLPGYYSIGGDIELEVDPNFLPYFLFASRHNIAQAGTGPYTYTFTPNSAGSTSTAASGLVQRTLSITKVLNGEGFGYFGCTVTGFQFRIEDGVLRCTLNIIGIGEQEPASIPAPVFVEPILYGADAHGIALAASATSPTFAGEDQNFNTFEFNVNYNGEAQNRIRRDRSASYVSYGITEATISAEIDFLDRTEYDNYINNTNRAYRMESYHPPAPDFATANDGFRIQANRVFYEDYVANAEGMGDLIMADMTGRVVGITGGDAYHIAVKSAVNIT